MSEWISVEDRLPGPGAKINIKDGVGFAGTGEVETIVMHAHTHEEWIVLIRFEGDDESHYAIHWQPLPEPPKVEGPFSVVGVGEEGWAINVKHSHKGARYVHCNLVEANRLCDWMNELWAKHKP